MKKTWAEPATSSAETVVPVDPSTEEAAPGESTSADLFSTSKLDKLKKHRLEKKKKKFLSSSNETKEERIQKAFDEYLEAAESFDAEKELKDQYKRMGKNISEVNWQKVSEGCLLYISSKFDILEWWNSIGTAKHPDVLAAALPILALPASNAFQERIFSTCTWYDDPLNQSLKSSRFEKRVLLGANKDLRKNGKGSSTS